jgi:hypothetical protein
MSDEDTENDIPTLEISSNTTKIVTAVVVAVLILTAVTVGAYQYAKTRISTVVLPGGTTYLGPPKSDTPVPTSPPVISNTQSKFTVDTSTPWLDYHGKVYAFTFTYPKTLSLVTFPNDPTDSVAFAFNNKPPQENILFRVSDINKTEPQMVPFIGNPKEYVNNWWKQYSGGLKGVQSITEFTNSKGAHGYKAKFLNNSNQALNDDIFFTVPGRTDLMVRFGNGLLDKPVFDRIVDSFTWTGKGAAATPAPTQP